MSDPNRLLQEGASAFERQLLSAGRTERPTREAHARLLVSLGVLGATTSATTSAGGAGVAGVLSTATKAWALKSLCAVALTVAAGAATVRVLGSSADPKPIAVSPAAVRPAVEAVTAPPARIAPLAVSASPMQPTPVPSEPTGRNKPPAIAQQVALARHASDPPAASPEATAPPRAASSSSLTEETAALDAARSALRGGRVTLSIALLDDFAHRFPRGLLQPEASAVRVEALLALGDRVGAETVARALVAAAPKTFAAHRVKAMLNW